MSMSKEDFVAKRKDLCLKLMFGFQVHPYRKWTAKEIAHQIDEHPLKISYILLYMSDCGMIIQYKGKPNQYSLLEREQMPMYKEKMEEYAREYRSLEKLLELNKKENTLESIESRLLILERKLELFELMAELGLK